MKLHKVFEFTLQAIFIIFTSGCNNGQTQPNYVLNSKNSISTNNSNFTSIHLGAPLTEVKTSEYDDGLLFPIIGQPSCVEIPGDTKLNLGPTDYTFHERLNLSNQQILNDITGDITLQINHDIADLDAIAKILDLNQTARQSFTLSISSIAKNVVSLNSKNRFHQLEKLTSACGSGYVTSVTAGIYFLAQIEIDFSQELKKQSILATFDGKVNDLGSLTAALDQLSQRGINGWSINLRIIQLGGNSSDIYNLLGGKTGPVQEPTPGLYLSSMSLSQLKNLQSNFEDYARNILNQQTNYTKEMTFAKLNHLMISTEGMKIKKYNEPKVAPAIYYDEESIYQLDSYQQMYKDLLDTYGKYERYYRIIFEYTPNLTEAEQPLEQISTLYSDIKNNHMKCTNILLNSKEHKLDNNCFGIIEADQLKVSKLISDIDNSGYKGAFKLKGAFNQDDEEYLIYLGNGKVGPSFITHPVNYASANYSPASIYEYNPSSKQIKLLFKPDYLELFGPVSPQFTFTLSGVDSVNFDKKGISYTEVNYQNQEYLEPSERNKLNKFISYNKVGLDSLLSRP